MHDRGDSPPIRILLTNMPELLRHIVIDLLEEEGDMRIENHSPPLDALGALRGKDVASLIVIEADAGEFAAACERYPGMRLMSIARNGRRAFARFSLASRESLRDAIRCMAREEREEER